MMWRFKLLLCCFCFPLLLHAQQLDESTRPTYENTFDAFALTAKEVNESYGLKLDFIRTHKIKTLAKKSTATSIDGTKKTATVSWQKLKFNASGQLIEVDSYGSDTSALRTKSTYEYDRVGNVLMWKVIDFSRGYEQMEKFAFQYNNIGKVARIQFYSGEQPYTSIQFGYTNKAKPAFIVVVNDSIRSTSVFEYDSLDRLVAKKRLDNSGAVISRDSIVFAKTLSVLDGQELQLVTYYTFNNEKKFFERTMEEWCSTTNGEVAFRKKYFQRTDHEEVEDYVFSYNDSTQLFTKTLTKETFFMEQREHLDSCGTIDFKDFQRYDISADQPRQLGRQIKTTSTHDASGCIATTTTETFAPVRNTNKHAPAAPAKGLVLTEQTITDYFWTKY